MVMATRSVLGTVGLTSGLTELLAVPWWAVVPLSSEVPVRANLALR